MRLIWFCRCRCRDTARCSCMLCACVCVLISLIRRVACNTRIEAYRTLNGLWRRRPLKARSEEWRTGNGPMAINIFKLRWAQHTLLSEEESRLSVLDSSSIVHAVQLTGCSPCSSWLLSHWRCGPSGVLAKVYIRFLCCCCCCFLHNSIGSQLCMVRATRLLLLFWPSPAQDRNNNNDNIRICCLSAQNRVEQPLWWSFSLFFRCCWLLLLSLTPAHHLSCTSWVVACGPARPGPACCCTTKFRTK